MSDVVLVPKTASPLPVNTTSFEDDKQRLNLCGCSIGELNCEGRETEAFPNPTIPLAPLAKSCFSMFQSGRGLTHTTIKCWEYLELQP
ncbi:hypothetical protein F3Y22_tig00110547pilonHSYRG00026 [Hibiscus syriacus]|uniref:Uncharacterized protein n=1 Tax=Hibiscus syriacus TaxID=106335 RepID=A0A6A3AAF0_HIBSY|nr:hypothetical protein F3Y22_tig00110547pilonHSYRG00026 [Hibiscus syriacus]